MKTIANGMLGKTETIMIIAKNNISALVSLRNTHTCACSIKLNGTIIDVVVLADSDIQGVKNLRQLRLLLSDGDVLSGVSGAYNEIEFEIETEN